MSLILPVQWNVVRCTLSLIWRLLLPYVRIRFFFEKFFLYIFLLSFSVLALPPPPAPSPSFHPSLSLCIVSHICHAHTCESYNLYELNGSIIGHSDKIDYYFFFARTVMNARIYYKALPLSSPFSSLQTSRCSCAFVQPRTSKENKKKYTKIKNKCVRRWFFFNIRI